MVNSIAITKAVTKEEAIKFVKSAVNNDNSPAVKSVIDYIERCNGFYISLEDIIVFCNKLIEEVKENIGTIDPIRSLKESIDLLVKAIETEIYNNQPELYQQLKEINAEMLEIRKKIKQEKAKVEETKELAELKKEYSELKDELKQKEVGIFTKIDIMKTITKAIEQYMNTKAENRLKQLKERIIQIYNDNRNVIESDHMLKQVVLKLIHVDVDENKIKNLI